MKADKKLLVVSYFFPPYGEVGAMRITKFVKYLLRFGWDITVVTVKEKYYKNFNYDWLKEVEGAKIIRTDRIEHKIPGINEEGLYWIPHLYKILNSLLNKETFKASLWTGGPFYHWILAPIFKKRYNLKYVLDFRDPWSLHPYKKRILLNEYNSNILKKSLTKVILNIEKILEKTCIENASYVINVTEPATEMYEKKYSHLKGKFATIHNGYDPEDFKNINEIRLAKFNIVYTGKFGIYRDPTEFLKGYKKFIEQCGPTPKDVLFVIVGKEEKKIKDMVNSFGLQEYVKWIGFKPYKETLQYIKGADICLLISGFHQYEPTTKIYDYIALNKPILAILGNKEGFLAKLLAKYKFGYICNNSEDIYNFLYKIYKSLLNAESFNNNVSSINIDEYNRCYTTKNLENILIEVYKC